MPVLCFSVGNHFLKIEKTDSTDWDSHLQELWNKYKKDNIIIEKQF